MLGKALAVMEYGDPGSSGAYTNEGGSILFFVPRGEKANFLILVEKDSGQFSLLGVTVQNVDGIEYSTFKPNVEFQQLSAIWCNSGAENEIRHACDR